MPKSFIGKARVRAYAALLVCNLIVFALAARVNSFNGFYYVADQSPFILSIFTFLIVGVVLFREWRNANSWMTKPVVELVWLGLLTFFWLCFNAFSSSRWRYIQAADCGTIPTGTEYSSVSSWCHDVQALRVFIWFEWIGFFLAFIFLTYYVYSQSRRGNRQVWRTALSQYFPDKRESVYPQMQIINRPIDAFGDRSSSFVPYGSSTNSPAAHQTTFRAHSPSSSYPFAMQSHAQGSTDSFGNGNTAARPQQKQFLPSSEGMRDRFGGGPPRLPLPSELQQQVTQNRAPPAGAAKPKMPGQSDYMELDRLGFSGPVQPQPPTQAERAPYLAVPGSQRWGQQQSSLPAQMPQGQQQNQAAPLPPQNPSTGTYQLPSQRQLAFHQAPPEPKQLQRQQSQRQPQPQPQTQAQPPPQFEQNPFRDPPRAQNPAPPKKQQQQSHPYATASNDSLAQGPEVAFFAEGYPVAPQTQGRSQIQNAYTPVKGRPVVPAPSAPSLPTAPPMPPLMTPSQPLLQPRSQPQVQMHGQPQFQMQGYAGVGTRNAGNGAGMAGVGTRNLLQAAGFDGVGMGDSRYPVPQRYGR